MVLGRLRRARHVFTELDRLRASVNGLTKEVRRLRERVRAEKRKRKRLEVRKVRGARNAASKAAADPELGPVSYLLSYPKSGRTWSSFLYYYYCLTWFDALDLDAAVTDRDFPIRPEQHVRFVKLLRERGPRTGLRTLVCSHAGVAGKKPYWSLDINPSRFLDRPTVLVIRDPRDAVVSHFHHLRYRDGLQAEDVDLAEFIRSEHGVRRVVAFLNIWADAIRPDSSPLLPVIYYEDLRAAPERHARRLLAHLIGLEVDETALRKAVELSAFDRLRQLEREAHIRSGIVDRTNRRRMRRGEIGGQHELTPGDREYLDRIVHHHLDPAFARYRARRS